MLIRIQLNGFYAGYGIEENTKDKFGFDTFCDVRKCEFKLSQWFRNPTAGFQSSHEMWNAREQTKNDRHFFPNGVITSQEQTIYGIARVTDFIGFWTCSFTALSFKYEFVKNDFTTLFHFGGICDVVKIQIK